MAASQQTAKKSASADWLVRGVLTKIGDIFDRLTGRGWKPSSSLATSELIERMKFMLDTEAKTLEGNRKIVPHNIKLKMQWDKFSTDSDKSFRALENEFMTAAIDHINDRRYYTYAPLRVEAKADYFTEGVRLFVSFEKFTEEEHEAGMTVEVPGTQVAGAIAEAAPREPETREIVVRYSFGGNPFEKRLTITDGQRLSIGRTKENGLAIDDPSVSKYHASLAFDADGRLMLADTGSTNGTFLNGQRIAYAKAVAVTSRDKVRFGLVDAEFDVPPPPAKVEEPAEVPKTETFNVGDFEFTKRIESSSPEAGATAVMDTSSQPSPTEPAIDLPKTEAAVNVPQAPKAKTEIAPQPDLTETSIQINKRTEEELEIP